jgi:hypothetical protein
VTTMAILLFLSTATVTGYAFVRFLRRGLSRAETLAWSFAAGLLVQAFIEVSLLAAGLLPGPKKIVAAETFLVAGCLVLHGRMRVRFPPTPRREWEPLSVSLLALSATGVFLFFCVAVSTPMSATDFLAIWGLKGRMIFATASIPARLFHDPAVAWAHPEYPLLLPVTFAALAAATRAWNHQALALLYPLCQLATVLALWGFLSRRVAKEAGAAAACLTALCFPLYRAGNVGTAEIPIALGLVLVASAAADALSESSAPAQARLALASLFAVSVKQEGTLFVLFIAAALLLRPLATRQRPGLLWIWAALPALLHAAAMRLLRGPVARRDYDLTLLSPARWKELLSRIGTAVEHIFEVELGSAAIPIAAILLLLLATRRSFLDWLLWPLAMQVLAYVLICSLSAFGPIWLIEASFGRIVLALFPLLTLLLAARLLPARESADAR